MDGRRLALTCLALLCAVSPALATDRFFDDVKAVSANGRYRVEARSPDNAGDARLRSWQSNFRFALTDVTKKKTVWTLEGGTALVPSWVEVDDSGWVVVYSAQHQIWTIDKAGKSKAVWSLHELPEEEFKEYVHETTAGPVWQWLTHQYFATLNDNRVFVLRARWDRRLIVDLQTGRLLANEGKVSSGLDKMEQEHVRRVLRRWKPSAIRSKSDRDVDEAGTAVFLAGRLGVRDLIGTLREMESAEAPAKQAEEVTARKVLWLRRLAQLSLRRLGEKPAGFPPIRVRLSNEETWSAPERPWLAKGPSRAEAGNTVKEGMALRDVLKRLGPPDEHVNWKNGWDYDMDAEQPYTLRVIYDWETKTVRTVQRIEPPAWSKPGVREDDLISW